MSPTRATQNAQFDYPTSLPSTSQGPSQGQGQTQSARSSLSPAKSSSTGSSGPAGAAYSKRAREIMVDEMGRASVAYNKPPGVGAPQAVPTGQAGDVGAVGDAIHPPGPGEAEGEEEMEVMQEDMGYGGGIAYRRMRAGTMPSKLDPPFTLPNDIPPLPTSLSNPSLVTPQRPGMRHAASSAAGIPSHAEPSLLPRTSPPAVSTAGLPNSASSHNLASNVSTPGAGTGTGSRHRSGSLGVHPSAALNNAFAASPFGSTWLNHPASGNMSLSLAGPSPLRQTRAAVTGPILMDAKDPFAAALGGEVTSPSDSHATLGQHFSTLDYLGLADSDGVHSRADSGSSANGASRLDDIRSPGQNGLNSRNRASTVSNFARPLGPSPSADDFANDEYAGQDVNQLSRAVEQMNVYDAYDEGGYYDSTGNAHRPRATTIGPLDNPRQTRGFGGNMPAAAAYGNTNLGPYGTSYLHAQALQGGYHQTQGHGYGVYPPRTRADHLMGTPMGMQMGMGGMGMGKTHSHSRSRDGAMRHAPRMSGSGHTSRTGTPMQDLGSMGMGGASTPQMPTRSLWIGNLDVTASQETLLRVFAPYGPIESVRLLPEKTCAFVNYIDRTDAIRARDDVLNRLGGHIAELSETAAVRVGFGKIDAAPSGQIMSAAPSASTSAAASVLPTPVDAPVNSSAAGMSENSNGGSDASNISPSKPDTAAAAFAFTSPEAKYKDSPFPIEAYGSPSSALATPNVNAHMFGGNPELLPSSGMTLGGAQQGPPGTSTMPTRALWIGSIPGTTSSATLLQIFSPFGPVESARVLMHKCCGFINFERLDSAVAARNALNGRDILGSDVGAIRIGFARVPTKAPTPLIVGPEEAAPLTIAGAAVAGQGASATSAIAAAAAPVAPAGGQEGPLEQVLDQVKGATSVSTEQQLSAEGGGVENYRSPLVMDLVKAGVAEQVLEKGLAKGGVVSEGQMIMAVLGGGRSDEDGDIKAAAENRPAQTYFTAIPAVTDRPMKRFDVARLKEHRKRLEGIISTEEVDELAMEWLEDSAELASDHIGNTVVQKLFERVSAPVRFALLERIAPHLATIGIHKNGTWAAQKIIECSKSDDERSLIIAYLRPFAPPLMCDSLGNYVCAGTLKFKSPHADYVFDAMIDRMWDVAQNRFGARCMRTCLESSDTSLYQKKRIATSIILNAIPLSTNPNGALLLTWLVDQSGLPGRYGLLANRFAPHIAHLCTHKLASLTVLRIISQSAEPTAAQTLVAGIFASPGHQSLLDILADANNGAQVIGKIIAVSTIAPDEKEKMLEAIRRVMPEIKASGTPPYRHLLEAAGLPVPTSSGPPVVPFNPHGGHGRQGWQGGSGMRKGSYGAHSQAPGSQAPQGYVPGYAYAGDLAQQQQQFGLAPIMIPSMNGGGLQHQQHQQPGRRGIDSPRTPVGRPRGRMSPGPSQMMSPGSDPFNPFASPSIDAPYLQAQSMRPPSNLGIGATSQGMQGMQFEQQPNIGGLGMGMMGQDHYYGQGMMYSDQ